MRRPPSSDGIAEVEAARPDRSGPGAGPRRARFGAAVAIFSSAFALVLLGSWAAIEVINVGRAYVAGEGLYSKAQKAAVVSLHRYAVWGDEADHDEFLAAIAVPSGDNAARRLLEGAEPDYAAAEAAFLEGRNHADDVWALARAFVWLSDWDPFARAVDDWRAAEPLIEELRAIGEAMRATASGASGTAARLVLLRGVDVLDRRLTALENSFSSHIGDAARSARNLVLLLLGLGGVLLWLAASWLLWRAHRKGVRTEEQLAAGERRFRDFAEVASDWFWEMDADLRFSYISPRFTDATGVPVADVIGRSRDAVAEDDVNAVRWRRHLDDMAARRPFQNFVYRARPAGGGEQYWSISGRPLIDRDGTFRGYRGTGNNVTASFAAQREMVAARRAAEVANSAKSAFLANMSHELRTPLNSIMGFSELLAEPRPGRDPRDGDYAGVILDASRHLLDIINDILDLSRIEAGRAQLREDMVDLAGILRAVCALLQERATRGDVRLDLVAPEALPPLFADARLLKQVLINLVANAVKFTPPGGRVRIAAGIDGDGGLSIVIDDTGIGIAAADIATVLEPFGQIDSSLSRKHEGTGLGLPLSKRLVELHQGRLEIASTVGVGTRVTVRLPAARLSGEGGARSAG